LVGAISGIISEPIKGGKKNGSKGAIAGVGKGLVGLIIKPISGTIDLVTMVILVSS
jgi:vacuolar protein sorting-associated protein 13A/C